MQVNLTIPTSCASNQTAEQVAQSARSTSPRPRTPEGTCARHTWAPHSPAKRAGSGSRMRELSNCIGSPVLIGPQWPLNNAYPLTPHPFLCASFTRLFIGKVGSIRSQCCICLRDLKNEPSLKEHMRLCHGVK